MTALLIGCATTAVPPSVLGQSCELRSQHAGVAFPVERLDAQQACRVQPIIANYTTANKIGPVRTPLPEPLFHYLLDRPPIAAALVNRLNLGLHKSETRGPATFWVTDGEGTEGLVELLYGDRDARIYYLEGTHDGRFLPAVSGRAVVLLKTSRATDVQSVESVETILVSYLHLNNRLLSGLFSLLRPLIGKVVTRQLTKAFDTAARLSQIMRQEPARVLFEATDPPALPDEAVAFLQSALPIRHHPTGSVPSTAFP